MLNHHLLLIGFLLLGLLARLLWLAALLARIRGAALSSLLLRSHAARNLALLAPAALSEPLLPGTEASKADIRRVDQSTNLPVIFSVRVVVTKAQQTVGLASLNSRDLVGDAGLGLGRGTLGGFADSRLGHVEATFALCVDRVRKRVVLVKDHANVLAVRMLGRVAVVLDVACDFRVDGVVTAHHAVLARPPEGAALLVEDVAGDNKLV